jgi:hypothetical protein
MMRLHPGAPRSNHLMGTGLLPSSDDSINFFSETLWEPLDWDNGQPEHTCDWDCLTMHTLSPTLSFFVYLDLQLMSVPQRWLNLSWVITLPHPSACSKPINFLSLCSPCLFIWHLGAGNRTWYMGSQEFRPQVQNLDSVPVSSASQVFAEAVGRLLFILFYLSYYLVRF